MTISTNDTRNEYTATAGQTVFNYTFKIFADTDLLVYQTLSGNDPDDTTDLITAYTVAGAGNDAGGSITLTTGASVGDKITIVSNIPESRTTDYQNNGDFLADTVNDDMDRSLAIFKQGLSTINRMPQFQNSLQSASYTWDEPVNSGFLRWKSDGSGLENVVLNTSEDATNAAAVSFDNTTSGLTATDVQAAIDEVDGTQDNLNTLSGVAKDATNLGSFTGSTISANGTIKEALQEVETAHEALPTTDSGAWTPTVSDQSNLDSATVSNGFYSRVGSVVNVALVITIDPTATGSWHCHLTLPVDSNFTGSAEAAGYGQNSAGSITTTVESIGSTSKLFLRGESTTTSGLSIWITASYEIIS